MPVRPATQWCFSGTSSPLFDDACFLKSSRLAQRHIERQDSIHAGHGHGHGSFNMAEGARPRQEQGGSGVDSVEWW